MSFNVNYSFNNGAVTGTANSPSDLSTAINSVGKANLNECTISGKFEGSNISCSLMFYECSSLTKLDLSNWDTSNVADMSYIFYKCGALSSVDLSNLDTSNVTNMRYMFFGCTALTSLDLSSLNTSNVTNMAYMFEGCINLEHIYVSDTFITTKITHPDSYKRMFFSCGKLPNYDVFKDGKEMAYIGGYFEEAPAPTPAEPQEEAKPITGLKFKDNDDVYRFVDIKAREDIEELRAMILALQG